MSFCLSTENTTRNINTYQNDLIKNKQNHSSAYSLKTPMKNKDFIFVLFSIIILFCSSCKLKSRISTTEFAKQENFDKINGTYLLPQENVDSLN